MSTLTHCDGPGCDMTQPHFERRLRDEPWMTVDQESFVTTHFCSRACLARWAKPAPQHTGCRAAGHPDHDCNRDHPTAKE